MLVENKETKVVKLSKSWPLISIALMAAFIISLFFYPTLSSWISVTLLLSSLGLALLFTVRKHLQSYRQGQITRLKFARNVLLDMLGFFLAVAAASYLGGLAGMRLGAAFGLWAGLIAGMLVAFLAAWGVRKLWGSAGAYVMS